MFANAIDPWLGRGGSLLFGKSKISLKNNSITNEKWKKILM